MEKYSKSQNDKIGLQDIIDDFKNASNSPFTSKKKESLFRRPRLVGNLIN